MRPRGLAAATAGALAWCGAAALAGTGIAAIVNDEIVSTRDVAQRSRLAVLSSGIADTEENLRRFAGQALRSLIEERLQLQEAEKRGVQVSEDEVARGVAVIEERNGMRPGELERTLAASGIGLRAMKGQIRATLSWQKLVLRRFGPRTAVGDDEVAERLARLREAQGREEYRLAEIHLAVDSPGDEAGVRETARRMVRQIRSGARFDVLARQFSRSATAAVGGDLGWTLKSDLDPEIAAAVAGAEKGTVLDPLRLPAGWRIVALIDKRRFATVDPGDSEVRLMRIFAPAADGAEADALARRMAPAAAGARCAEADALAAALGARPPMDLDAVTIRDLAPRIRDAVIGVAAGRASAPVRVSGGVAMFLVCARRDAGVPLPDAETVFDQLHSRRLDLMARRYMRELRRAAVIDVRAPDGRR